MESGVLMGVLMGLCPGGWCEVVRRLNGMPSHLDDWNPELFRSVDVALQECRTIWVTTYSESARGVDVGVFECLGGWMSRIAHVCGHCTSGSNTSSPHEDLVGYPQGGKTGPAALQVGYNWGTSQQLGGCLHVDRACTVSTPHAST